jgi:hypothetical protein
MNLGAYLDTRYFAAAAGVLYHRQHSKQPNRVYLNIRPKSKNTCEKPAKTLAF